MKWSYDEPKKGDIVRVCFGNFYHYGIFVSDDEVIQFGLSPTHNAGKKESDIKVLSSNVDVFIEDGFLEVATLDNDEEKRRRSADETVEIARSRIGEGGYHLLYNNCEHFVNSCVFGKASCSAVDEVRNLIRSLPIINVYTATIPDLKVLDTVYPPLRDEEIRKCSNFEVAKEKYFVWKLLCYALERTFGKKAEKINFRKTDYGKWVCDEYEFSLSHSHGAVVVAVSRKAVGVDVEIEHQMRSGIETKILSDEELAEFYSIIESERNGYLLKKWTQKESVFKTMNIPSCPIKDVKTENVKTFEIEEGGHKYFLSVATPFIDKIKIYQHIQL